MPAAAGTAQHDLLHAGGFLIVGAATAATLQDDYADCWKGLEKRFDPNKP